jgi:hypothetical protein
MIMT